MTVLRALVWLLIGLPVLAGAGATLALSLGLPGRPGFAAYAQALALPGAVRGLALSLGSGLAATLGALLGAFVLGRALVLRPRLQAALAPVLAPVLAVPYAALALGLAFLLAPSGWLARLFSPWATGWVLPPALVTVGDGWGLTLSLGLMLKELPFLTLMVLAGAMNLPVTGQIRAGISLGHTGATVWRRAIWPQLYPALRRPVFVTLAFAVSVADMAVILGPSHPPTAAVQILRLFNAPDAAMMRPAAALAVMLLVALAVLAGAWRLAERPVAALSRRWPLRALARPSRPMMSMAGPVLVLALGLFGAAVAVLVLWAFALRWPWPEALPSPGLDLWVQGGWLAPAWTTTSLGLASAGLSLLLAVAVLETEDRSRHRLGLGPVLLLPLLLPQIGFLPGLTSAFLRLGLPPGWVAVLWAQSLFVFPYVLIALAGPWRALSPEMLRSAASLGAGPWRCLFAIRLPLLLRPMALAAAVGFAVSAAQYLAVLLPGGGRVATLGSEAVALASGADRRIAAVMGLAQALLPLLIFVLALRLPAAAGSGTGHLPDPRPRR